MNGYEFFVVDKSNSLRILLASGNAREKESLLPLFTPGQAGKVYDLVSSNGGICPCADEARRAAIFTSTVDPVALVVCFDRIGDGAMRESIAACKDAMIRRLQSVFERAENIANSFSALPKAALTDADFLLSEFMRTRRVEAEQTVATLGFAVIGENRLISMIISCIVFLHFLLNEQADLEVEISNCGGIFRAAVRFAAKYLKAISFAFSRICGEDNVIIRTCDGGFVLEILAAVEDNSKIGLKSSADQE